ncbi:DNA/RNA non-specific endonuclease [Dyadobacter sp. OTU695]|uniref:DNA/RNA non-specific endonuclease n=1 Tax=Dyadobacter sp. OTU695 TaxID=3043860 RepID=UPI00313BBD07
MAKQKKEPSKGLSGNDDRLIENLKKFVRTQGADYLNDANISSIGIGYKEVSGKPTKEVSIQFTVRKKAVPEMLDELETIQIPKSFIIDGVEVPTDVIQRTYDPSFRVVGENVVNSRKTRLDPIVPGVSVANVKVSAGTIGGIVFDRENGTPYILSNWHVLHGPEGNIGDDIVQPGPHDDNRINLNKLGKLVRSHLGAAGDCAIASIESRSVNPEIFELNVIPEKLGEPELGDKVVKSGRTTNVTHGIVTRIHTIVKIDYGRPVGEQSIGCFEIGPDNDHLPDDGEISQGGDSGSLWLFKSSNGKPSNILAGLHFAGEGQSDPDEHALACYPRSVFDKLNISLTSIQPGLPQLQKVGYSRSFLGPEVDTPRMSPNKRNDTVKVDGAEVIHYTHFSLAQSKSRRFAFWVAWNIDGSRIKKISRNDIKFDFDPRISKEHQVGDALYAGNRLDRGHIARRADLVWGDDTEARQANKDSFYFTNITPQMDNFNQSALRGIWGELENSVFEEVDVDNLRVSVFGGPVFSSGDREFRGVKIPREFYKILVYVEAGKLKARAFILTQNLSQLEVLDLKEFRVFQVKLSEIEERCDFTLPDNLKEEDDFAELLERVPEAVADREPLASLSDIIW